MILGDLVPNKERIQAEEEALSRQKEIEKEEEKEE